MYPISSFFTKLSYFTRSFILSTFDSTSNHMNKFLTVPFKINGKIIFFAIFIQIWFYF